MKEIVIWFAVLILGFKVLVGVGVGLIILAWIILFLVPMIKESKE